MKIIKMPIEAILENNINQLKQIGDMGHYRLSEAEQAILLEYGYEREDFPQIAYSCDTCEYTLCDRAEDEPDTSYEYFNRTSCDRVLAVDLLGKVRWLSGIARASFHRTAVREYDEDGSYILFRETTPIGMDIPKCYFEY